MSAAGVGDEPVSPAGDLERKRLGAGGLAEPVLGRPPRVHHHHEGPAGEPMIAGVRKIPVDAALSVVVGEGGADAPGLGRLAACYMESMASPVRP